ncbi:zinc ribbon domain-containing protein [Natrialbaceae archaeon A-CW2]|uniref:zinc ribbon domain-containing protein n=1 Tax=Natronosalvus amylolyticus TaxID=2961994 RepID=UPI0020C9E45D|nr:zinc ribbon domain-containing protein [Natronosalvus amylolyticus]
MTMVRVLIAAGLSLLWPGVGHAMIREWIRALFFSGLFITAMALSFTTEQITAVSSLGELVALFTQEASTIDQIALSFLAVLAATDTLFRGVAASGPSADQDGPACPQCGRPLDEDLEFCHWCTTRLEPVEDETPSP